MSCVRQVPMRRAICHIGNTRQVTAVKMGAVATKEWEHVGMKEAFILQSGDYRI